MTEDDNADKQEPGRAAPGWGRWVAVTLVLAGLALAIAFSGSPDEGVDHYGLWSLLPPLIAIVLAFWLQEVVSALFIGILAGGIISGNINVIDAFLIPAIGTESFALILLVYLWALGDSSGSGHVPVGPCNLPSGPAAEW